MGEAQAKERRTYKKPKKITQGDTRPIIVQIQLVHTEEPQAQIHIAVPVPVLVLALASYTVRSVHTLDLHGTRFEQPDLHVHTLAVVAVVAVGRVDEGNYKEGAPWSLPVAAIHREHSMLCQ